LLLLGKLFRGHVRIGPAHVRNNNSIKGKS
jgi:hypothetical protein